MDCPECESNKVITHSASVSKEKGFVEILKCLSCGHKWEETSYKS